MWPHLISESKKGGVDVIETYVFWNGHEPVRGQVQFLACCFRIKNALLCWSFNKWLIFSVQL